MPKVDTVEHVSRRSATAITQCLRGTKFPADKSALIARAEDNGCADETLEILNRMPEGTYEQMADVTHNMSRVL